MTDYPIPSNETLRLEKLRSYNILDSDPEDQFDQLTKLAAQICDVPICVISLIDENRQWFKSAVGLDAQETSREVSFCQYTIMGNQIMEVPDPFEDERFSKNPLVTGEPKIRFYAGAPLIDHAGLNMGTICVIGQKPKKLDDTQHKALETIAHTIIRLIELRRYNQEREQYAKFFMMSIDMLCIAGTDGFFKEVNPAFTSTLGWSVEELKSRPFLEFIHPDDTLSTLAEVDKLSKGALTIGFENRYKRKDGGWTWMYWNCQPLVSTGELFAVAHDITALKEANKIAQKSVEAKETFLANMSHEIRTPLNAIIGFTDLLTDTQLDEEQLKYVSTVSIASDNLLMLVNNVLDISKIESGKIELEQKRFSLKEIVEDLMRLNSQQAKAKDLKLISSISYDIPEFVVGDPARLMQILLNLMSNALKFTPEGTVELQVIAEKVTEKDALIKFVVKDTGIGIAKDKLEKIFERFAQAESSTTRKYGGTGLGLSIVKSLVDLHNGQLDVKSALNYGAEFSIQITYPLPDPKIQNQIVSSTSSVERSLLDGVKILLVEDNEYNQILALTYLRRNKAIVELAENGEVAVQKVLENNYDCVIMDLQMPVMNGFQATEQIRNKLHVDIPIIACTAHSLEGEKEKSLEVGMNDYITKPYSEMDLVVAILEQLKGHKLNQKVN